jgi:site-specific recombinase XerD
MTPSQAFIEIDNFLKYMENIQSASPHTLKAYKIDLSHLLGPVKTSNTDKIDLKTHISVQLLTLGGVSPATRNRKVGSLKSFLTWMYDTHLIDTPMAEFYHSPKVPRKIPHFISFDEVTSCLEYLAKRQPPREHFEQIQNKQQRLLFLLLYGAGLRISEACQLKFRDVNETEKKILVRGKGSKERFVVCPDFVWQEWTNYKTFLKASSANELKIESIFFRFVKSQPVDEAISERTGYEWVRATGAATGLTKSLNPHALRHSFATHLLNSGANLRVIQSLLGHATLAATEKYTHLNLSQLYQTMETAHPLGKLNKRK